MDLLKLFETVIAVRFLTYSVVCITYVRVYMPTSFISRPMAFRVVKAHWNRSHCNLATLSKRGIITCTRCGQWANWLDQVWSNTSESKLLAFIVFGSLLIFLLLTYLRLRRPLLLFARKRISYYVTRMKMHENWQTQNNAVITVSMLRHGR